MSTFDTLQTLFLEDLRELQQLRKRWWLIWPMTRLVKEEHLGHCCYMAEEFLSQKELDALKRDLGLAEQQHILEQFAHPLHGGVNRPQMFNALLWRQPFEVTRKDFR